MKIEVLGMGCQKCSTLVNHVKQAMDEMGIEAELVKVQDIKEIMKYGVMTTPALIVGGVVKVSGRVPTTEEIKAFLK